jgi:hypothetical protein
MARNDKTIPEHPLPPVPQTNNVRHECQQEKISNGLGGNDYRCTLYQVLELHIMKTRQAVGDCHCHVADHEYCQNSKQSNDYNI